MRILHLIDPGSPGGGACTLRLLAGVQRRLPDKRQDVLVLGNRRHVALCEECGVEPIGQLALPAGLPFAARNGLRRFIQVYEAAGEPFDIVHSWSPRAALLANLVVDERHRLASFTVGPVTEPLTEVFVRSSWRRPTPVLAGSTAVEREYVSMGFDPDHVSVHPPGVDIPVPPEGLRERLRERWNVPPDSLVVALLSAPVSWADVRLASEVAARVSITGRDIRLLVHHGAHRRVDAERRLRELGLGHVIVVDDEVAAPWLVLPGIDVALLIGGELNSMDLADSGSALGMLIGGARRMRPMPGNLPLLWAMGAGVPVIAEASDAVRDVIEEGISGLLVNQHDVNAVSDRLARLYDDRTIAGRIGMAARERVMEEFTLDLYASRLADVYERAVAGRPVRVISEFNPPVVELVEQEY